jgi:DNA-directed RNA polymerase specialized sigma24 family protein
MKEHEEKGSFGIGEEEFDLEFSRIRGSMQMIAEMVLDGAESVEEAIKKCQAAAARRRNRFASEGEFRSWLMREMLNEALVILRERQSRLETAEIQVPE